MSSIAAIACEMLERRQAFVLATIVQRSGSAPRTSGSRMIVDAAGAGFGTIGGGLLEGRVMEKSRQVLREGRSRFLEFDMDFGDAAASGMICGGRVRVLLALVRPNPENRAAFTQWRRTVMHGDPGVFVSVVRTDGPAIEAVDHGLVAFDGSIAGNCPLPADTLVEMTAKVRQGHALRILPHDDALVVLEPCRKPPALYVFGGGHVAQPTVHLAALVGFRVTVLDDRAEFANAERFPEADAIRVPEDFAHSVDDLAIDGDSYIVIVTRGHLYDRVVLGQVLKTAAAYIGMIGSRRKIDAVYRKLEPEGFTDADFARVHAPIGLDIGAETPEEIAVSIVAELIQKRAETLESAASGHESITFDRK